jgi:hypothetical protein
MRPYFDPRFHQGKWHEVLAERDAQSREEGARLDAANAERARGREEIENAQARARAEQQQRGG